MTKKDNYLIEYDLMRIVFMLMTLAVHVVSYTMENKIISRILDNFFIACNPLFFMLSGKLNLAKEFKKKTDYIEFYKKKFVSIIIPFIIFSIFIQLLKKQTLKGFCGNLLSHNLQETYWFIYVLIGILMLSPFYSKMFQNMNNKEKRFFFFIITTLHLGLTILDFFEVSCELGFGSFGIIGWHFYYFYGYIIEDVFTKKREKGIIYLLTVIFFVIICIINNNIKYYYNFKNPGIILTLLASTIYFFIKDFGKIKNEIIINVLRIISKYSYVFYLAHMTILEGFVICGIRKGRSIKNVYNNIYSGYGGGYNNSRNYYYTYSEDS